MISVTSPRSKAAGRRLSGLGRARAVRGALARTLRARGDQLWGSYARARSKAGAGRIARSAAYVKGKLQVTFVGRRTSRWPPVHKSVGQSTIDVFM